MYAGCFTNKNRSFEVVEEHKLDDILGNAQFCRADNA